MMDRVIYALKRRELRRLLIDNDPDIFEPALQFLENDPRTFQSGYYKQKIWRYIARYPLNIEHIERLEETALIYLQRPMTPEFRLMCLTMARIATISFWQRVEQQLQSDDRCTRINAACLFPYSQGVVAGEKYRLASRQNKRYRGVYNPLSNQAAITAEEVLNILRESENWIGGQVVKLSSPPEEIIIYYDRTHEKDFLGLDYAAMKPDTVLPKLERVLFTRRLNDYSSTGWLYAIYALGRLRDKRAVSILEQFLKERVDYKFESVSKSIIKSNVAAALERLSRT